MLNIVLFLEETKQIYQEFKFDENLTVNKIYLEFYNEIITDLKDVMSYTTEKVEKETFNIKETFPVKKFTNYRFAYWRIERVGLTGKSLETKLSVNRVNWLMYYKDDPKRYIWSDSDKDDARLILDQTASILQSLSKAWGFGDIVKELIDLAKTIAKKWVSVKDDE